MPLSASVDISEWCPAYKIVLGVARPVSANVDMSGEVVMSQGR